MKPWLTLAALSITPLANASEIVTLQDGRQITLHNDFTWQYVDTSKPQPATDSSAGQVDIEHIPVITKPATANMTSGVVTLNSDKSTMQLSDSGLEILIGKASYAEGQLHLPTSLTNQGHQAVILATIEVVIMDMSGHQLQQQQVDIWQSIKRLPETYLRPKQAKQGKTIVLNVPEAQQYQLSAQIVNITTR